MLSSETASPSAPATATFEPTPTLATSLVVDAEPTATATSRPTVTSAPPTATVSPTPRSEPTATNTSEQPAATPSTAAAELVVTINANLRRGPGNNYSVEAVLLEGTRVRVIARTSNQQWYNVALLDEPITGWLWQGAVEVVGEVNPDSVEVAQTIPAPPPTATASPTPTPVPPTATPTAPPQQPPPIDNTPVRVTPTYTPPAPRP